MYSRIYRNLRATAQQTPDHQSIALVSSKSVPPPYPTGPSYVSRMLFTRASCAPGIMYGLASTFGLPDNFWWKFRNHEWTNWKVNPYDVTWSYTDRKLQNGFTQNSHRRLFTFAVGVFLISFCCSPSSFVYFFIFVRHLLNLYLAG